VNKNTWMIPFFALAFACTVSAQMPSPDQRARETDEVGLHACQQVSCNPVDSGWVLL
jgi:hypothetical protein